MRTDVRADAQTTIELTAQLRTFMKTDVRTDAQTTTELTAQLTTESTTESTAQLIEKPIMRVCIDDLERPSQLDVSVTWGVGADKLASLRGSARSCSQSHSYGLTFVLMHGQHRLR